MIMAKILIIDDERAIRNTLKDILEFEGYEVNTAEDGEQGVNMAKKDSYDLIYTDIKMPKMDGMEVCQRIREFSNVPIVMLTAKGEDMDKILGLDLGADDYLAKPFGMLEMISRVKSVLRRTTAKEAAVLSNGNIVMNVGKHSVSVDGEEITLTLKEFDLLKLFLNNQGYVLTRDQLIKKVWGQDFRGETRTVDVHIGTLRTKLGNSGNRIETIRGVGYRMEESK